MDALKLANLAGKMVDDGSKQIKPMTPDYKARNKEDIKKTINYTPETDFNAKLKKWLGLE